MKRGIILINSVACSGTSVSVGVRDSLEGCGANVAKQNQREVVLENFFLVITSYSKYLQPFSGMTKRVITIDDDCEFVMVIKISDI